MKFYGLVTLVYALLQHKKRLSYLALKQEFDLDDVGLEALRVELIQIEQVAIDQDGEFLIWTGPKEVVTPDPATRGVPLLKPLRQGPEKPRAAQAESQAPGEATADVFPLSVNAPESDAERRQITVMFCDLVGSTALSTQLDPEDLRELLQAYQSTCVEVIKRFGGFIARYMGDGVLVYFGYPQATELDAERALHTGLAIVEAMHALNANQNQNLTRGVELAVRVGLATGIVVVGDLIGEGVSEERNVVGETPNLAARLQGLAEPNGIVVGSVTKDLAGDRFLYEDLGAHELKGITGHVKAWAVVGERELDEAAALVSQVTSPLVGRQEELGLLMRAWAQSQAGQGQVMLVGGEAGIGKTRLVEALGNEVKAAGFARMTLRCSPYHTNTALYPVIEHLKRVLGWGREDDDATKLDKLEQALSGREFANEETIPLLAGLLSLSLPERYPALQITPQEQRQRTLDEILAWLFNQAERQPVLQVWEDLNWADPTTLELLTLELEQCPTVALMIAITYRPDFTPPWPMRSHITPLTLNRLEPGEVEQLIRHHTGGKALPADVVEHIAAKAEGVPMYVKELTKTIIESDFLREHNDRYELTGPLSTASIPSTLQDSLTARLDRLPSGREVAQLGAVLGREFAYDMIQALSAFEEPELQKGLKQLVEAELLYQRGRLPQAKYTFKQALIQDAAYQLLLKRTRQRYHRQVAEHIEAQFPETAANHPELVAHHAFHAEDWDMAFSYSIVAGETMARRFANREAVTWYDQALQAAEHLGTAVDRARLMGVYQAKANLLFTMSDFKRARAAGEQFLALAQQAGDHRLEAQAYATMGKASTWAHDFESALADTRRAIEISEQIDAKDILATSYYVQGCVSSLSGRLNEGEQELGRALHYSRVVGNSANESLALAFSGAIKNWEGDYTAASQLQDQATLIAREQNLSVELMGGQWRYGLSLTGQGRYDDALRTLEETTALSEKLGDEIYLGRALNSIGWLYAECGAFEDAVDFNQRSGEIAQGRRDAEMLANVKLNLGDIALAQGDLSRAKEFHDSVEALVHAPETTDWMRWRWTTHLFVSQAELALAQGKFEQAQALVQKGLEIASRTNSRKYLVKTRRLQGEIALAQSQRQEAEQWLKRALSLAETLGNPPQLWKTHQILGRLYEHSQRPDEAQKAYESASRVIDAVKTQLKNQTLLDSLENNLCLANC
jgi:predicted ATPase/class 3 adenylate cyclase